MSVGLRALSPTDPVQGAAVPVRVLYPATAAAAALTFGPYALEVAVDAPPAGAALPVAVISHGMGGSPWAYRGLALALVGAGYAVILVEHPGDSRADGSLSGTAAMLAHRPRHVTCALDAAAADPVIGPALAVARVAVIGHSMGGYTALACAGGRPMALPEQTPERVGRPVEVTPDPRVAAAVLLAPALPWFLGAGALAEVRAPLLVRVGERDGDAPALLVERALASLPPTTRVDLAVVPGAGHFAWWWPVPAPLAAAPMAQDPPGFDRDAYQPTFHAEVIAFLGGALAATRARTSGTAGSGSGATP